MLRDEVVVRQAARSDEDEAGEFQVADGEKGLDEGDTGVTGADYDDSCVLDDLGFREHSPCGEAKGKWRLYLIKRVTEAVVDFVLDVFLLLFASIFRDKSFVVPLTIKEVRESA